MNMNQINFAIKNIHGKVEIIDDAFANKYLEKNDMNRPVNRTTVRTYVNEILHDWWAINGEPIIISDKDRLLDGQQRLHAVIESGKTIGCFVVRGINEKDFDTMNQGRKRTNGTIENLDEDCAINGHTLSAVVKAIHSYNEGGNMSDNFGMAFSHRMMKHCKGGMGGVESSVEFAENFKKGGLFTQTVIASLYHIFTRIDDMEGHNFMLALITGDYGNDTAIRELRNHFIELKLDGVSINRNRPYVCGVVIKAWNAWRKDGSPLQGFEYAKGDGFPVAI